MRHWLVVAPENDTAAEVRECLVRWARRGLIDPPWWWSTHGALEQVESADGTETVSLAEALSGPLADVRLLGLAAVARDGTAPVGFDTAFGARQQEFVAVLPQEVRGEPVRSRAAVVAVVPYQPCDLDAKAMGLKEASGLVILPEDRDGPTGANHLVTSADSLPALAAMVLASLGGTWAGANTHPLASVDQRLRPHHAMDGPVQGIRAFSRFVEAGYLIDHIAARVLNVDNDMTVTTEDVEWIDLSERQIDNIADAFFARHKALLSYEPIVVLPPARQRTTLWREITRIFRTIWQDFFWRLVKAGEDLIAVPYDALAGFVERHFVADPNTTVDRWRDRDTMDRPVEVVTSEILDALTSGTLEALDGAIERTWKDLLEMAVALADAGTSPEGLQVSGLRDDRAYGVKRRAQIVPDPAQARRARFGAHDPPGLRRPCDPRTLRRYAESFEVDDDADKDERDEAERIIEQLGRWAQWRTDSLLWKIGERIVEGEVRLETELGAVKQRQEERAEAVAKGRSGEPRSARRHRRFRRLLRFAMMLVTAAAIVCFVLSKPVAGVLATGVLVIVAIAWASSMLLMFLFGGFRLRRLRAEWEAEERRRIEDHWRERVYPSFARRIGRRYQEYLEWSEIISWFIHQPVMGGVDPSATGAADDEIVVPNAMKIGVVPANNARLDVVARRTRSRVLQPGWLKDLVGDVIDGVQEQLAYEWSIRDTSHPSVDPFADGTDDPNRPRRRLLDAAREGRYREAGNTNIVQRIVTTLGEEEIAELFTGFNGVAFGTDAEPLPRVKSLTRPTMEVDRAALAMRPAVVRIECSGSMGGSGGTGVVVAPGLVATNAHVVADAATILVLFHDGAQREAAISVVAEQTDLALLRVDTAEIPPMELLDATEIRPGMEILALGYPDLLAGEPTLSRGMVAATDRVIETTEWGEIRMLQHDAPSGPGSSGSPICDLGGRLVGIHSMGHGSEQYSYMKFAVPEEDLRTLLHGVGAADARAATAFLSPLELLVPTEALADLVPIEEFLGEVAPRNDEVLSFSRPHWKQLEVEADRAACVEDCIEFLPGTLAEACSDLALGKPVVLRSLRIDLAPVCEASALRYFRGVAPAPTVAEPVAVEDPAPSSERAGDGLA